MKKTKTKDQLFRSFADFRMAKGVLGETTGGGTNGASYDADGCSSIWIDTPGGYCHTDDYTTEG
jgi:hypothetical protein